MVLSTEWHLNTHHGAHPGKSREQIVALLKMYLAWGNQISSTITRFNLLGAGKEESSKKSNASFSQCVKRRSGICSILGRGFIHCRHKGMSAGTLTQKNWGHHCFREVSLKKPSSCYPWSITTSNHLNQARCRPGYLPFSLTLSLHGTILLHPV